MRIKKIINEGWLFSKTELKDFNSIPDNFESVNLPYTWNGIDGQDGGNDYYRGKGYFVKKLLKSDFENEVNYIEFGAVNSSAEVYFNGKKLAEHHGGYSAFRVKIEDIKDENILVVIADNSPNDRIYPQMADFTFYGGIYRDVTLISVPQVHFDLDYYGSPGIKITPTVKGENAEIEIVAYCEGNVEFSILDGENVIYTGSASGKNPTVKAIIENVHLWNARKDPHLYTAVAKLPDDEVSAKFGCRTFSVDANRGFILNGEEYPLRGVSRHQDRPKIGNALLPCHHEEDIDLICEVGANTVRLAHYQHDQYFYDLCDEKGLVVWAEIPYISRHLPNGFDNTMSQMKELVIQNYNHASICFWGLSNEITMGGASDKGLIENHRKLNSLVKSLDKTRLTTLAALSMCSPDEEYLTIPDIFAFNHYFGWYGGDVAVNGPWFDDFHKKYPNRPIGLSEYGCEALNWHTSHPEQGDYTEEYQAYYHEEMIKQLMSRKYLWATHVWNMFDFAADSRAEGGENGMNHKGLVTFDRKYKKDSFYAYKAWLSDEPVLHICGKRYVYRTDDICKISVYSNLPEVELFVNGESVGKQNKGEYPFFTFEIKNIGKTEITAKAGDLIDVANIEKVDTFFEDYRMKDANAIINWFEIETPPGYYSINDTIGDIMQTFRGKLFILSFIKTILDALKGKKKKGDKADKQDGEGMSIAGFKINKQLIDLLKSFTVKRALMLISGFFSDAISKDTILSFNAKLNKIKKKNK
ncbi:MAG TPA: glycoside hydrolase family 2 protein [Clostridiales bacterium]|nr:glycoside hydrolase family 2 protein [Clostridiales bacterium]